MFDIHDLTRSLAFYVIVGCVIGACGIAYRDHSTLNRVIVWPNGSEDIRDICRENHIFMNIAKKDGSVGEITHPKVSSCEEKVKFDSSYTIKESNLSSPRGEHFFEECMMKNRSSSRFEWKKDNGKWVLVPSY